MTSIPPMPHATYEDGTRLSIQLFTIAETGLGPYVGLPITSLWFDDTPHLFTRETAAKVAADVARDDLCMSYAFAADGTLTLQWTDDYDALGRMVIVVPDAHGRYLLGGLWPWAVWGADGAPHTAGQAAYALGAAEYRLSTTTHFPDGLIELYDQGREEAHRVTLRRDEP
ncbi:hypothetical protein C6N75_29320 [Streptomyces solincola]|uniref:Uncharacterized protein n=1 Tax=Streptomyces solincola TaxID=2100817 RepID=A0A2S9PMV9_9ACTN|nr:hypothetical protein [Streptomyces solincola]PRH75742.1 hypothetical protein C6N75_29320 [Streptomyces solincola]